MQEYKLNRLKADSILRETKNKGLPSPNITVLDDGDIIIRWKADNKIVTLEILNYVSLKLSFNDGSTTVIAIFREEEEVITELINFFKL